MAKKSKRSTTTSARPAKADPRGATVPASAEGPPFGDSERLVTLRARVAELVDNCQRLWDSIQESQQQSRRSDDEWAGERAGPQKTAGPSPEAILALDEGEATLAAADDELVVANSELTIANRVLTEIRKDLEEQVEEGITELRDERERLRGIIETAPDAVVVIDENGIVNSFNPSAERLFGYTADEITGRNVSMLMPPPDRDQHDGYMRRYLRTGEKRIIGIGRDVMGRHKDGSLIPVRLSVGEPWTKGEKRFFSGFLHDLTGQKAIEAALDEERGFVSTILETTEALVLVLDRKGRISRFNGACERLSGYRSVEVMGEPISFLIAPERRPETQEVFDRLVRGEGPIEHESEWISRDGRRALIHWTNSVIRDSKGAVTYVVRTGIDITHRRQAERELLENASRLRDVQAQLFHVSRLADLGELASSIGHELNQPLTAVINYAQTIRDLVAGGDGDAERMLPLLEKAVVQADRAGQIIRRLRQLYERGETERRPIDLNGVVHDAAELALTGAATKGIATDFALADDLPSVLADRVQVQQVVFNLVRNAVEALEQSDARRITIGTARVDKDNVEIHISDSGPGLDPEIKRQLFSAFITTKPRGSGIGLSISRSIVEAHRGKIWAAAGPEGKGTSFHVRLPINL